MKYKISLLLFLFTLIPQLNLLAASSVKCKKLEKTRLGCVPSQDHICGLPKGLNEYGKQQCAFVDNFSKTYKLAPGIFPFECLSKNCVDERVCTSEGCQIVTTCTCSKYADPICTFTCTGCWKKAIYAEVGKWAKCVVCHRPKCEDEKIDSQTCPQEYNGLRNEFAWTAHYEVCNGTDKTDCPHVDPNGEYHENQTIITEQCPPQPKPIVYEPKLTFCPWKEDLRTGGSWGPPPTAGNCEPISEDNRFIPERDAKW